MDVFGRKAEIEILERIYQSSQPEFMALFGRRRVGKTYLVKQFFKNKAGAVFFNVTGSKGGSFEEQTSNFIVRIGEVFYNGLSLEKTKDWNKVFALLTKAINEQNNKKKVVLFFDELPWMATRNSRLLQNLEYYWNQYWSDNPKIKLIICGSSASWIINKIINNTGGLHNRLTEKIHLEPFDLHNTREYLNSRWREMICRYVASIFIFSLLQRTNCLKLNPNIAANPDASIV